MSNARTSDISRRYEEALDEAEGVLSRFIDVPTGAPRTVINMDDLAADKAVAAGLDATDADDLTLAARSIQNAVKERCVNEMTRLDRVYLDLDGKHGRKAWMSTDTPSIAFCALKSTDATIQRHAPDDTSKCRALAVYFDPQLAGTRNKKDRRTGEWISVPDQYSASGYVSVVGAYSSIADAESAREELYQALQVIATPGSGTALEDDPVRSTGIEHTAPPAELDSL